MRRVLLVFVIAAITSAGVAAQPTVSIRGNVGATFFRSPRVMSDILHSGVDLGVGAGIQVYRGFELTVHGTYDQFTLNEENARLRSSLQAGDLSFLSGSTGLRYTLFRDGNAQPYVEGAIGIYRVVSSNRREFRSGEVVGTSPKVTRTKKGAHVAVGAKFRFDDIYALFFEPRYTFVDFGNDFSDLFRYYSIRLGIDVQL